jgi:hypothetical protein
MAAPPKLSAPTTAAEVDASTAPARRHRVRGRRGSAAPACTAGLCWAAVVVCAQPAWAHPQAAEGPTFEPGECVTVLDKSSVTGMHIAYSLPFDDTEIGFADIPLPDAKTHQFFAFMGAVHPADLFFALYPTAPSATDPILIPDWISVDDVQRSAQASPAAQGVSFSESDVPEAGVLENLEALRGLWTPITQAAARVPITLEQASRGAHWTVSDVAPGIYTVAGYIFSPPYNGWKIRPGLVKVIEGGRDLPAAVVDPINEILFERQGRRVGLCLSTPPNSRLRGDSRIEGRANEAWTPWLMEREVASGRIELCFHDPRPAITGSIRLRFEIQSPDGAVATFYSPDTLTALEGGGACAAGRAVCCDFPGAEASSPAHGAQAGSAAVAEAPGASAFARQSDAGNPASGSTGCTMRDPSTPSHAGALQTLTAAAGLWLLCRRLPRTRRLRR